MALLEGLCALTVLVLMQFVVAWSTVRSRTVGHWVRSEPTLLVYEGCLLGDALRRERVTEAEVLSAVRSQGVADLDMVGAVVLETDGSFTVVPNIGDSRKPTLKSVRGWQPDRLEEPR